jgi:hypothetical protein
VREQLEALGFPSDAIEEHEDFYLVEGDMMFSKRPPAGRIQRQAGTPFGPVDQARVDNITVFVDDSIPTFGPDNWRNEIQQAINDWNTVGGSRLRFVFTTDPGADVIVRSAFLANNTIANAAAPQTGLPGTAVQINLTFNNNQSVPSAQKRYNMVHELGHIIGLHHTNWSARGEGPATDIPATPCADSLSVMNGGTAARSWTNFSFYDREAVRILYPIDRPADTAPFLRYYNQTTGDHFYTVFFGELGCGSGGYVAEGITGNVFTSETPGTVPIHRYWSGVFGDHFYTLTPDSFDTYIYEGIAGYVFDTQTPDNMPIFWYFNAALHDNFFTQYGTSASGYVLQGVAWYAVP